MFSKLLSRGSKQDAKSDSNGNANGSNGSSHTGPAELPRASDSRPRMNRQESRGPQGNLLPLEDIYRATGLLDLRTGYNIQKVVEMLGSAHIRNLSDEMRRASILMALDAADIPVEEVLKDARLRLEALSKYESDQQKRIQDFESQKLQENAEIQTELGQVTAHYQSRMKSNLDDVTQVRDPFQQWQSTKQEEVQRISEAVALCSRRADVAASPVAPVAAAAPITPVATSAFHAASVSSQPADLASTAANSAQSVMKP